jgi:DGQHR domain-containing protein
MIITKPAVKVQQGNLLLYTTAFTVEDLLTPGFYKVDKLDASSDSNGFQRVLDKTRAKRLADYLTAAWEDGEAFLPTSIFLATDQQITFDASSHTLSIDTEKVCPFNVVDGQHRVAGLILAAEHNTEIRKFQLTATIAVGLDEVAQMCHFLIVNTTQRPVDRAVEQQIIARLSAMTLTDDIPTLPKWIQRQVDKDDDRQALEITNYLNSQPDSPWYRKIRMANEGKDDENTINQRSFVQSIKSTILTGGHPIFGLPDSKTRCKAFMNYWRAVADLLVDPNSIEETVIFKTIGLELFNLVAHPVFNEALTAQNFKVEYLRSVLKRGLDNLPNDLLPIQHPDWWKRGQGASGVNKAKVRQIASEIQKGLVAVKRVVGAVQL